MKRIVWATKVLSKNFVSDFGAELKNIIGGRLKAYEKMTDEAIKQATDELLETYPDAKEIKMQVTELGRNAITCIVYGVVDVAD